MSNTESSSEINFSGDTVKRLDEKLAAIGPYRAIAYEQDKEIMERLAKAAFEAGRKIKQDQDRYWFARLLRWARNKL